ncbi:MAG: NTP transferase domain-containing protein [Pseudomonadota bacterium]
MTVKTEHFVVLAAQRPGIVNALAAAAGVSHKCIMPMHDRPLIEHVLSTLDKTPQAARITVSIDDPSALDGIPMVERLKADGRLSIIKSGATLFDSVAKALNKPDAFPAVITTADNVLLTPKMLEHFCAQLTATDVGVAMCRKDVLLATYPDGQRRFHRFADGEWSNCNLYALMTPQALAAAEFFRGGGQFAKSLKRVMDAFGLLNMIAYRFAWFARDTAMVRLSKRSGVTVKAIDMPFAEAPIDVDNERTARIAAEILAARAAA